MQNFASWFLLHGSMVLAIGLALGAPYRVAINHKRPAHVVNDWRVAHGALSLGGATLIAIAAALGFIAVPG